MLSIDSENSSFKTALAQVAGIHDLFLSCSLVNLKMKSLLFYFTLLSVCAPNFVLLDYFFLFLAAKSSKY